MTGTAAPVQQDESELVAALARGDRAAADALVDRTYPTVFRFLCRMCRGNASRAADLTQETFRRAWAALDRFESRSSFSTWLCRIAYNAFLDEVRRTHESPADEDAIERAAATLDDDTGPADAVLRDEAALALRRAVMTLDEDLRFTVLARYWADASAADIAHVLGISEVAVRKRLRRALAQLADTMGARSVQEGRR